MKKRHVIDAGIVAAACFPETFTDRARRLLASGDELYAPEFIYAEVGNVIWKRFTRGEITQVEALETWREVLLPPLVCTSCKSLVEPALQLALQTRRTVYDCMYLALAVELGTRAVTTDQRLVNALRGGPMEKYVVWIGDV